MRFMVNRAKVKFLRLGILGILAMVYAAPFVAVVMWLRPGLAAGEVAAVVFLPFAILYLLWLLRRSLSPASRTPPSQSP